MLSVQFILTPHVPRKISAISCPEQPHRWSFRSKSPCVSALPYTSRSAALVRNGKRHRTACGYMPSHPAELGTSATMQLGSKLHVNIWQAWGQRQMKRRKIDASSFRQSLEGKGDHLPARTRLSMTEGGQEGLLVCEACFPSSPGFNAHGGSETRRATEVNRKGLLG
jgi:hypothetical protein